MISDEIAVRMARKFFKEENVRALYTEFLQESCLIDTDDAFEIAARVLGKKRTRELYFKLPRQLKTYFLLNLMFIPDQRFQLKMDRIYHKLRGFHGLLHLDRPERSKRFPEIIARVEDIVLAYLKGSS